MSQADHESKSNDEVISDSQTQKIQLYFSARNLVNFEYTDAPNTFLKVYIQETDKPKKQILQTKVYWKNPNPDYAQTIITQFLFEVRQKVIVQIYHQSTTAKLFGMVQTTVGQIVGSSSKGVTKKIFNEKRKEKGKLIIKCQQVQKENNTNVQFTISCNNLHNSSGFFCFGISKCFFCLYKEKDQQQFLLYRSEVQFGQQARFKPIKIKEKKLCNNIQDRSIILKFYKMGHTPNPLIIGKTQFTLADLKNNKLTYGLLRNNKNKGNVLIQDFKISKKQDFAQFIMNGMKMSLEICIDFTGSNGDPRNPNSLHYSDETTKSQYQKALEQVCQIIMDYGKNRMVPTYGFGSQAYIPGLQFHKVSHYFPLNGNFQKPQLQGLEGIIKTYKKCMKHLKFSGPTIFAPLLKATMQKCKVMKKQQKQYKILLVLTDGDIHDKDTVKDLLVNCANLPLSVIIIGIGHGKWQKMHELDDDQGQMRDKVGNKTQRDLVQFVQFSQFQGNGVLLAKEVLQQLPRQVVDYHQLCFLKPCIYKRQ